MKVKLKVSRAGSNFVQSSGQIIDVSDGEAERMVLAGQAVHVDPPHPTTKRRTTKRGRRRVETAARKLDETR